MSPQNEVPAIAINASGAATILLHVIRDAQGKVVSASTDFDVSHTVPGMQTFTGLHIHAGAAGINGPVTINTGITAANPVISETGAGRILLQAQTVPDNAAGLDTVNGMLANPAGYYVNLHSAVYPGGVIRAQLQRADVLFLMGQMSPRNEIPALTGLAASAIGSIYVIATRDGQGRLTSGQVTFDITYQGFPEGTVFSGLHIHDGGAAVNGPVTINTGISAANSVTAGAGGGGNLRYDVEVPMNNPAAVSTLDGLFNNAGNYYQNLHTTVNPGGAVRSQLRYTDTVRFPVNLSPVNEVPAVNINAVGPSVFEAHTIRDNTGAAIAGIVVFDANFRMPGDTTFTGMHIHNGAAGVNGPVTIDSGLRATAPVLSPTGQGNIFSVLTTTTPAAIAALNSLLATPESHYLNIHSTVNPGGVLREQLVTAASMRPNIGAVISAVSDPSYRRLAPGGLATIFGSNLMRVQSRIADSWDGLTAPKAYNGTSVKIGDLDAPISETGPGYMVVQVPFESTPGTKAVTVRTASGGLSNAVDVIVAPTAPALFFDRQAGIFVDQLFRLTGRPGAPARKGEVVIGWGTGFASDVPLVTGQAVMGLAGSLNVQGTVDGRPAAVLGAAAAPGFIGLYQVYITIPADARSGMLPVVVRQGEGTSNSVNIMVQ